MIRISQDRCGYSGYKCTGLPTLDAVFFTCGTLKADPRQHAVTFTGEPQGRWSELSAATRAAYMLQGHAANNYLNLPTMILTDTTQPDILHNMDIDISGMHIDCITQETVFDTHDINALTVYAGKLSYKEKGQAAYSEFTDASDSSSSAASTDRVSFGTNGVMCPSMMTPVTVYPLTPPANDIVVPDTGVIPFKNIIGQLQIIDDWIIKFSDELHIPDLCPVEQLMVSVNSVDTACENFKISLARGVPLVSSVETLGDCTYTVSAGTLTVNGTQVAIPGGVFTAAGEQGFYIYANLTVGQDGTVTGQLSTEAGPKAIGIGGVKFIDTSSDPKAPGSMNCPASDRQPGYKMYTIERGSCMSVNDTFSPEDIADIADDVASPRICGLGNLLTAANMDTKCPNLNIKLESGNPLGTGGHAPGPCTYKVESSNGGKISVNGVERELKKNFAGQILIKDAEGRERTAILAPFYLYICYSSTSATDYPWLSVNKDTEAKYHIGLGGVRLVESSSASSRNLGDRLCDDSSSSASPESAGYSMYVISQDNCMSNETIDTAPIAGPALPLANLMNEPACTNFDVYLSSDGSRKDTPPDITVAPYKYPEPPDCKLCAGPGSAGNKNPDFIYYNGKKFEARFAKSLNVPAKNGMKLYVSLEAYQPWEQSLQCIFTTSKPKGPFAQIASVKVVYTHKPDAYDNYYSMWRMERETCIPHIVDLGETESIIQTVSNNPHPPANAGAPAPNFRIRLVSGTPLVKDMTDPDCYYQVYGGHLTINGKRLDVSGLNYSIKAPFTVYLNIQDNGNGHLRGFLDTQPHDKCWAKEIGSVDVRVGGVVAYKSAAQEEKDVAYHWRMCVAKEAPAGEVDTLIPNPGAPSEGGGLQLLSNDGTGNLNPWKYIETGECPTV